MDLYLVRHAIAERRGSAGVLDDHSRKLTPAGIKKMQHNVEALCRLKVTFDEIWTSPLLRAKQTADILVEGLRLTKRPYIVRALAPGQKSEILIQRLSRHARDASIALVGHEPDLGKLASYLLLGSPLEAVAFKKGGVARIEVNNFKPFVRGCLHWLLTPKQMQIMR